MHLEGGRAVSIHPMACVDSKAHLGNGVRVEAFARIEGDVSLGDDCVVRTGAVIRAGVRAGCDNEFCEHSVIGGPPQHAARPTDTGSIEIGDHNVFREGVTIHLALKAGHATQVGDHNYIMAGGHLGHDVVLGNHVIFANGSMLGGHVTVEDRAFISGGVAVHQFCRVGKLAMVGGHARVVQDIPPYMMVDGISGCIVGLNTVGLRRSGHTTAEMNELKAAYRIIYRHGLPWREVIATLREEFSAGPAASLADFLAKGTRGFAQERRGPPAPSTIKLRVADEDEPVVLRAKAG
jgi:UDP-N-acetylglucosamine acyltransferase